MKIVIDLQLVQNDFYSNESQLILNFTKQLSKYFYKKNIFIILNSLIDSSIDNIVKDLSDYYDREEIIIYNLPDNIKEKYHSNIWLRKSAEIIREYFIKSLCPDVLIMPFKVAGWDDDIKVYSASLYNFCTTVFMIVDSSIFVNKTSLIGCKRYSKYHNKIVRLLNQASLILTFFNPDIIHEKLNSLSKDVKIINYSTDILCHNNVNLTEIVDLITQLKITNKHDNYSSKKSLALISQLHYENAAFARAHDNLCNILSTNYNIKIIVDHACFNDINFSGNKYPLRSSEWFKKNYQSFERVIYVIDDSPCCHFAVNLSKKIPGVVIFNDTFLKNLYRYISACDRSKNTIKKLVYESNGYSALYSLSKHANYGYFEDFTLTFQIIHTSIGILLQSYSDVKHLQSIYTNRNIKYFFFTPHCEDIIKLKRGNSREKLYLSNLNDCELTISVFVDVEDSEWLLFVIKTTIEALTELKNTIMFYVIAKTCISEKIEHLISGCNKKNTKVIAHVVSIAQNKMSLYYYSSDIFISLERKDSLSSSILINTIYTIETTIKINEDKLDNKNKLFCAYLFSNLEKKSSKHSLVDAFFNYINNYFSCVYVSCRQDNYENIYSLVESFYNQLASSSSSKILKSIANIEDIVVPPTKNDIFQVTQAIHINLPCFKLKEMFIDVSNIIRKDWKTGIQRVVRSVILGLIKNPPSGYRVEPVYFQGGHYLYARKFTQQLLFGTTLHIDDTIVFPAHNDIFLGLDFYCPLPNLKIFREWKHRGVYFYFIVYDLLPVLRPDVFPESVDQSFFKWISDISSLSDGLIAISRSVADELLSWLGSNPPKREFPLHIGYYHNGSSIEDSAPTTGLPENAQNVLDALFRSPSILMVGTIEPRKGYSQALSAFDLLWTKNIDVNLVIVGHEGWKLEKCSRRKIIKDIIYKIQNHDLLNVKLFWLEGISDEYLEKIYRSSSALLAASEGEGFGLPLIEASQYSLPIIARDIPVFREVAGEHAYYYTGMSDYDLANAISDWLLLFKSDKQPRSEYITTLNWDQSITQLSKVIFNNNWYARWSDNKTVFFY